MAENPTVNPPPLKKPPGQRTPAAGAPPPPRRQPLPPTFRHAGKPIHHHRRRRRRSLCCYFAIAALTTILILAIAIALSYLYFQPRLPSFRLQSLKSPHLTVAPKSGGLFLTASIAVRLFVSNPNPKIALDYSPSVAAVAIPADGDDVEVGTVGIGGFELGPGNWTVVRFNVKGGPVSVDEVTGSMIRRRFRNKRILFRVEVRMKIGFGFSRKWTGKVPVRVVCGPVSLRQGMRGDELFNCPIYLFRWIKLH